MKHPLQWRSRHHGSEWISALFTLIILLGIYRSTDNFDSYSALFRESAQSSEKRITVATPYWNNTLWYGFRSVEGDSYTSTGDTRSDKVLVVPTSVKSSDDGKVRVTFYKDTPIDTIEASLTESSPRAYSRLSNGIAVIEWDLASPSAKTILATLHAR